MVQDSQNKMLDFLKYSKLYFGFSLVLLTIGVGSLAIYGLKPGIDFTGGALLELAIDPGLEEELNDEKIREALSDVVEVASVQDTGTTYILRLPDIDSETNEIIKQELESKLGEVTEVRFESVGPVLGEELLRKTIIAVVLATISILGYIAYRFSELKYGVCAILAMLHDTLIVIGVFSLLGGIWGVEVDTLFVTALLTTLSFSVHDTIVVYDRIRELLRVHNRASFEEVVNKAILETLSRSINNSMTIIFMLTALFLLGGETIRWFVFALLVGTIIGTYSSTFTAAPLLVVWAKFQDARKKKG